MSSGFMGPEGPGGPDSFGDFLARFLGGSSGQGGGPHSIPERADIARLMSEPARELVATAATYAARHGSTELGTEHLLRAALATEPTRALLQQAGADPDALAADIDRTAGSGPQQSTVAATPAVKRALLGAHELARATGASYIGPEHVLGALAANPDSAAGRILNVLRLGGQATTESGGAHGIGAQPWPGAPAGQEQPSGHGQDTPTLDKYSRDLTDLARNGRIDPVIGREEQIEQTIEVLSRRGKNNPVLIGDAGVGKTAIVEGLAQRITDGDVPDTLLGRRVISLDLSGVVAGTRYRGDFEERLNAIIEEIRGHSDALIVFIDELHTVVGAGGGGSEGGSMEASNMLKPALARGELHVIGATTLGEYRRYIEKDAALARRFQPILVPEPTVADTVEILRGLQDRYEAHHQVRYTGDALVAAVELSDRYITDRFLPDKAIDLIDQAGARVRLRSRTKGPDVRDLEREAEQLVRDKDQAVASEQYERATELRDRVNDIVEQIATRDGESTEQSGDGRIVEVTAEDIAEVVSRQTGIPVSSLTEEEKTRLLGLADRLHARVVGQDDAVTAVSEAVLRSRTGLADPNRPIGSFLFLGPTGVGKTELARALAEALFGSEDRMVRLDMSEYQERHTVSRLVGSPPGYVGHEDAGQLTEAVRRHPYSLLLLDEVEKAHPDVFNLLLQVLDEGHLTDAQGRRVDFKNTVVVMTSNLGSEALSGGRGALGFGPPDEGATDTAARERAMSTLREHFRPEFLNRLDDVIVFHRLTDEQLREVTGLLLDATRDRLRAQHIDIEFSEPALDWLSRRGRQPEYGARPLRRTIQREIDNELSRLLLDGALASGDRVRVEVEDDKPAFRVLPRTE
ncbi:ATP-dependent Clp protease ATP-binding subunit [Streptomyces sp. NBC_00370]|uniref:ATP-dependent Clp protease ATP-binding subunit n=1 Tax=Streptomyces sp. NBC_00370 TaxID=2975728 RepID=UPI002E25232D